MVRIQLSRQTVKGLQARLQRAYQQGHVALSVTFNCASSSVIRPPMAGASLPVARGEIKAI